MDGLAPLDTSLVGKAVTDDLRQRREAEGPRPTSDGTRGRGSQAGQCGRRIAFDVAGIPRDIPDSDFNLITWEIGQDAHNRIQAGFRRFFDARIEVPVSYRPDYDVSGNVDVVYDTHPLTGETRPNLISGEIKSMSQFGFDIAVGNKTMRDQQPGPKREHVVQAAMYAGAPQLQSQYLHMVYYGKDKGSMAEWIIGIDDPLPHLDGTTPRQLANDELERLTNIFTWLDAGNLPARHIPGYGLVDIPAEPDSRDQPWNCRYCAYQPTCKTLPTGDVALDQVIPTVEGTATVDDGGVEQRRVSLLDQIRSLSTVRQTALKQAWPTGLPALKQPDGWTDDTLTQIEAMVRVVTAIPDETPIGNTADPLDEWNSLDDAGKADRKARGHLPDALRASVEVRQSLRRRLLELPSDLRTNVETHAVDAGIPHLDHAAQFSIDDATKLTLHVEAGEELHRKRLAHIHAVARDHNVDDDRRHELIVALTDGRTDSSKDLTGDETDELVTQMTAVAPTDWRTACKTAGVTQTALLRHLNSLKGEGNKDIKKVDRIPDRLANTAHAWLTEQSAAKASAA